MVIEDYKNYKEYVSHRISAMPRGGRGEFLKISRFLNVHTSLVSQTINGPKELSLEQAEKLSRYFALNGIEKDYFLTMVNYSRAGTEDLKEYYDGILEKLRSDRLKVKNRLKKTTKLTSAQKNQYYSDWRYIAIWLASSLDDVNTIDDIYEKIKIDKEDIARILEFLESAGFCEREEGKIVQKITETHLDKKSLLINRHHTNWRIKAIQNLEQSSPDDLYFSGPLTISKHDFQKIKKELLTIIEKTGDTVEKTNPELVACLNLDLFYL